MALRNITREAVSAAVEEFDRLGRADFLGRYGYKPARGFHLVVNGRQYDSKAIAGVAHQYMSPGSPPLRPDEFSGGDAQTARVLRALGFEVTSPREAAARSGNRFVPGVVYHRQRDIHQVYGGQERGGIATPRNAPFIFLFSGQAGEQHGYMDRFEPDGSFLYVGEGQRPQGDQQFIKGNRAIRDHIDDGKDLLLFLPIGTGGQCRYQGEFVCDGAKLVDDVWDGGQRKVIRFRLVPLRGAMHAEDAPPSGRSLEELRKAAYAASTESSTGTTQTAPRTVYERAVDVREYVLARADGSCESCRQPAPFTRRDGTAYLEPHHIRRVSDGGPDDPRWVGAICPTCHRRIHHGGDGGEVNERLQKFVQEREKGFG